jgi:hypothetical protein
MDRDEAERLFCEYFETIEELAASESRDLDDIQAEEFDIRVKNKLCADDYGRIRQYEARNGATFRTFLGTVIENLYKDFLNHIYGRLRATEEAKREGENAVLLEHLLRERYSADKAFEIMRTNHRIAISRPEFEQLLQHVKPRFRARIESVALPEKADPAPSPEETAIFNEMLEKYCALLQQLRQLCQSLGVEDALILKFRFEDGRKAGDIEDYLGWPRDRSRGKKLFTRLERLMRWLKKGLESAGYSTAVVKAFLSNPGLGDRCDDSE